MPRVRRSTAKVQEADAQKMDEVAVNVSRELVDENNDGNVTILEQLIVAEKSKHATEMALRKELIELKKQHQMELRELQESLDSITEEKPKVSRRITKDQAAARKTISLALPKFCGEPDVWPFFISSFKTTTEECGLNNIENMKRLMDSLGGEALEAVKGRLIFPDAVPGVIKELESRFGRPRKLLENLLRKVRETPSPTDNHLESFITFGFKVKQLCDHLVASNMTDHQNNPFLVEELIDKLPPRCKVEWVRFKRDKEGSVMAIFGEYIQTVIDEVSEVTDCTPVSSQKAGKYEALKQRSRPVKSNAVQMRNNVHDLENSGVNQLKMTCWVCSNTGHSLKECDQFKEMTLVDRFKTLEKLKICKLCLSRSCRGKCKIAYKCRVEGCNSRHHTLMHCAEEVLQVHSETASPGTVIYRTMPITLYAERNSVDVIAFIDEGSSGTLLEAGVAKRLNVTGPTEPLVISWTNSIKREEHDSKRFSLKTSAQGSSERWNLLNVRTVSELLLPKPKKSVAEVIKKYKHLSDVPVLDHPNEAPSMIIGLDNIDLFAALETRIGNRGEPIAVRSKLGWTVYGVDGYRKVYNVPVNMHQIQSLDNRQLHDMMKQQYQLEELRSDNYNPPIANEEQRARDILEKTTCRVGDRFQTGLLWRDDVRELPESYPMAEKRMLQLSRKLSKKPDLNTAVCRMIQEYQDKGYAHELAESELVEGAYEPVWYLPLNVVQHAKKPDKIRLVWDAAASVDGVSLNSLLLKGPDMLVPLPKIICKFREKPIAFGGDIKEMFHQLRICEKDKHAQRFLFGTKPCGAPRVYVMDVATFGATCSPCSAQYVKNLNAREFAEQFPGAASAIIGNHYVDDYYDSADSVGEAVELAKDVRYHDVISETQDPKTYQTSSFMSSQMPARRPLDAWLT
ncbi:uncharacterized protein LOC118509085 [Anopheles stephensi]|uniref:uncharacterized protein LOC118509085 n=1 Tax=Anopheles stephensi TaxID=30069 RepID=UPI0016589189|nr:uncharacterized protein LOC118509085 [Anopheles stephensi]